jgi:hypothetical protein
MERIDCSVRSPREFEYGNQIATDIKKPKSGWKIRSEVYLQLPLYKNWNRSITKKFPIETLLELIDSSARSLGEVEYDNNNWLAQQKTPVRQKIWSEGYLLLSLYIN